MIIVNTSNNRFLYICPIYWMRYFVHVSQNLNDFYMYIWGLVKESSQPIIAWHTGISSFLKWKYYSTVTSWHLYTMYKKCSAVNDESNHFLNYFPQQKYCFLRSDTHITTVGSYLPFKCLKYTILRSFCSFE